MKILGINDHHNASAALLVDGKLLCAMQEERFVRAKNFWGTPKNAIQAVLDYSGIDLADLDRIVFAGQRHSGHRSLTRDEHMVLLKNGVQMDLVDGLRGRCDVSIGQILKRKIVSCLRQNFEKTFFRRDLRKMQAQRLGLFYESFPLAKSIPNEFLDHHTCHYATAGFGSKNINETVLIFTNDNQGDRTAATVSVHHPDGSREVLCGIEDHDSIGMWWGLITLIMGFVPLEHEYKLMGMAPYADPERSRKVADSIFSMFEIEAGKYKHKDLRIQSGSNWQPVVEQINRLMKFQRFDAICGGLQMFTEEILVEWVEYWIRKTGVRKVCCSGGTFMNVKANLRLMESELVDEIFVFPSCGDETNAIGACYQAWMNEKGERPQPLEDFCLGMEWGEDEIRSAIDEFDTDGMEVTHIENIEGRVAELLAEGEIVARFKGREEFGARALGNRSILANPGKWDAVSEINDMIKQRDFWMPFACSMLEEDKGRYLVDPGKNDGSYMIMAFQGGDEIDSIVAGTHPRDKTVRPQVVSRHRSPEYHALISRFKELTGIGAVLNTSFNLHGWPLVHTPENALSVLRESGLKNLAIGNYLVQKRGMS